MTDRFTAAGIAHAPTDHPGILDWVRDVAELTHPDRVVFCDGSRAEWDRLTGQLVDRGTFVPLPAKPNSFWCVSDPDDVFDAIICLMQNGDEIGDRLVRLGDNVAVDDLAIFHGDLPGDMQPTVGLDGASKRQRLAACSGLASPITLDGH